MANSLILNIPHASTNIPSMDDAFFFPAVSSSKARDAVIQDELYAMTDWYTDELFDHSVGKAIIAPVSRLVCDTERFSHDDEESMATRGMGFCYEKGSEEEIIKEFPSEYKDEVLWRYYAPHHIALTDAVEASLNANKCALILDCHSFSSKPLQYEPEQGLNRPDICIGTDEYHTPDELLMIVEKFFRVRGYSVSVNYPYSGTIVPLRFYRKDKRVQSIMIEINRGLYLKEGSNKKNKNFQALLKTIFDLEVVLRFYIDGVK